LRSINFRSIFSSFLYIFKYNFFVIFYCSSHIS
jgi:hypothetical protein